MENERLQQRLAQLRLQSHALDGTAESFFNTSDNFGVPAADSGRTNFELGVGPSLVPDADDEGPRKKVRMQRTCDVHDADDGARPSVFPS